MGSRYEADIDGCVQEKDTWVSELNDQIVRVSVPSEFGGVEHGSSPEHLFAAALLNCYVATFRVISEKSQLEYGCVEASIEVELEPKNDVPISQGTITLYHNAENMKKAEHVAEKAKQHCYVHQSVKTSLNITVKEM